MAATVESCPPWAPEELAHTETGHLVELAARCLEAMFDRESGLFCFKVHRLDREMRPVLCSLRYTPIALLGLHRFGQLGGALSCDPRRMLRGLLRRPERIRTAGDLGLLLWACAHILPGEVDRACRAFRVAEALERFPDAAARKTRELAWLLTGLTYCRAVTDEGGLSGLCLRLWRLLRANFAGPVGLFGHQDGSSLRGRLRRRFANLDDQVYPVYALTRFGRAFKVPAALETARLCADTLCRLQGPLGQWWWHYDAHTGRVVGRYPVYTVNQAGIAPMALLALSAGGTCDYRLPVLKGLAWLLGRNELRRNLVDEAGGIIWHGLHHPSLRRQRAEETLAFLTGRRLRESSGRVALMEESRPYDLGWLLYALAPEAGGGLEAGLTCGPRGAP